MTATTAAGTRTPRTREAHRRCTPTPPVRVRAERTLEAWPDIAGAVGLSGSRVMSAVVELWGWRARIGLRRGQTADVIAKAAALESGLGTRPAPSGSSPTPPAPTTG